MDLTLQKNQLNDNALRNVKELAKRFEQKNEISTSLLNSLRPYYESESTRDELGKALETTKIGFNPFEPFGRVGLNFHTFGRLPFDVCVQVSHHYDKHGEFPRDEVEMLRPLYNYSETRERVLKMLADTAYKLDCNPFTLEKFEHPRVAEMENFSRLLDLSNENLEPLVAVGHLKAEHQAAHNAVSLVQENPNAKMTIYRREPLVKSKLVNSESFEAGEIVYLSFERADHMAQHAGVSVASKEVSIKDVYWGGFKRDFNEQAGGHLDFRWDPRD